ncbi:EAL domain-containing protein (putative c-di-GMP-specific phosphodiesterase class I) [Novosphingobium sp. PhB165]|uniref:EAL domain-containing protein n=1 Tax=Novosphingobium sp. PhB165 TaxID=2485105 RepID=UPI001052BBDC|nr:EAL domain-containing protein [Novosphingobium sp. PhB165]TCM15380.1 EAL domain-containing protein (putative c-di-GMP-specific phosphodiesterase class I) [Novosphingobium sp. PhB165]
MIDLDRISPPDRRSNYLVVLRIDNARALEAAYGSDVLCAAVEHIRQGVEQCLEPAEVVDVTTRGLTVLAHAAVIATDFVRTQVDELCLALSTSPLHYGEADILLSISAGYSDPNEDGVDRHSTEAKWMALRRLKGAVAPALAVVPCNEHEEMRYRADMAIAAPLIMRHVAGETFFAWRPIFSPEDPSIVLRHEALLRYPGERGEQFDCARPYRALVRIGLAHLLDRLLVIRVLDELEADPEAELSIEIALQSLSFDLCGQDSAWTELMARLEQKPELARRLVLEVHEATAHSPRDDTFTFLGVFRALGGRLSVAGFGSCSASIREVARLRPDTLKLDSAFIRTAFSSGLSRARFADLVDLARSLTAIVVADGVETPDQWDIVAELGVQWIVGARRNRASTRRIWFNPVYDRLAADDLLEPPALNMEPVRRAAGTRRH